MEAEGGRKREGGREVEEGGRRKRKDGREEGGKDGRDERKERASLDAVIKEIKNEGKNER